MKLDGKVAIVTGGGAGIGRGIAQVLAEKGADIAIVDIADDNAKKVAIEIQSTGGRALAVRADVTKNEEVASAIEDVIGFFGKIDILINNAGGYPFVRMEGDRIIDRSEEEWDRCYELNLKSQVLMCRAVIPHFIRQKNGKIVNIASVGALLPITTLVCYGSAKSGVIFFSRMLARELASDNINVNCICPGSIYTPLQEGLIPRLNSLATGITETLPRDHFDNFVKTGVPLGREQTPEDIGYAVLFFVSDEARNITGQVLNVDGGLVF